MKNWKVIHKILISKLGGGGEVPLSNVNIQTFLLNQMLTVDSYSLVVSAIKAL